MPYSSRIQTERQIAIGRALLAAFSLLAIWLDPAERVHYVPVFYAVMGSYVIYAVGVALIVPRTTLHLGRLQAIAHAIDIAVLSAVVFFIDGPTSLFFVFFVFVVITAALRWEWRQVADGLEVLRGLRDMCSATQVILLAASISDRELVEALRLGVRGLVLKEMAPAILVDCVRRVHAGEVCVENQSMTQAIDLLLRQETGGRELAGRLTRREIEIVEMVVAGLRNRDIARQLTVSEGTVKVHLHNTYTKLGVDSRLQLLAYARKCGLG